GLELLIRDLLQFVWTAPSRGKKSLFSLNASLECPMKINLSECSNYSTAVTVSTMLNGVAQLEKEVTMKVRWLLNLGGYVLLLLIAFLLVGVLQHITFAQTAKDGSDLRDRVTIQEKLLYAYAYAYDSKDCLSWANLFTADAVFTADGVADGVAGPI